VDIQAGLTTLPGLWAMEENGGGTAWLGLAAPWWKSARKIKPERRRGDLLGWGAESINLGASGRGRGRETLPKTRMLCSRLACGNTLQAAFVILG